MTKVIVTKKADGYKLLDAWRKAFVVSAGDEVDVLGGPYARSLVEDGLATLADEDVNETAVKIVPKPEDQPPAIKTEEPTGGDLTTISGLGDASAKKLAAAGVVSFVDLIEMDVASVAVETGIQQSKLNDWQASAVSLQEGD